MEQVALPQATERNSKESKIILDAISLGVPYPEPQRRVPGRLQRRRGPIVLLELLRAAAASDRRTSHEDHRAPRALARFDAARGVSGRL